MNTRLSFQWCGLLLPLSAMLLPHSALAGWSTHLAVTANDSATHRPSEDYEATIDDEVRGEASVGYDGRTSFYGPQFPVEASASASFDLATGETKFYVESAGYEASASAGIQLSDTIYPVWESGYSGIMDIQIDWAVTGEKRAYVLQDGQWNETTYWTPKNWGLYATFGYRVDDGTVVSSPYGQYNLSDGVETWSQHISFDPTTNTSITIAENMYGWLDTYNSQKAIVDFSHSGIIELTLPEGASYTSDSGTFLVPEPATAWLLALATMTIGCLRWRRFA